MKQLLKKTFLCSNVVLISLLLSSCENETSEIDSSTTTVEQESLEQDWTKITYNGKNLDVQKLNDYYVWGDILIPISAAKEISNTEEATPSHLKASSIQKSSIVSGSDNIWPNNTISYYFDSNFGNVSTAKIAIHHWELFTTIDFVESTNQADSDLIIYEGSGCNATVGYRDGKHENAVSIGDVCDVDDAIHEFGHVVGLYHEHNRNDRDDYVQVFYDNIFPSSHSQFEKNEDAGFDSLEFTPFDFESVMLYSSDIFSIEGINNSMLKLNGQSFDRGEVLSKYDIIGVESIYRQGSPKKVAISSLINGGKYLSSENGNKEITSTRSAIGAWETFTVHPVGGGLLSLQASNGKFLSVDETGALKFSSSNVGDSEKFLVSYEWSNNDKIYYNISHEAFSTMFIDDITNEIKIDGSGGGGQDSLFAIEILD